MPDHAVFVDVGAVLGAVATSAPTGGGWAAPGSVVMPETGHGRLDAALQEAALLVVGTPRKAAAEFSRIAAAFQQGAVDTRGVDGIPGRRRPNDSGHQEAV